MKIRFLFLLLFFTVSCAYSEPIIVGKMSVTGKAADEMGKWKPTFNSWLDWFYFIRGNDFIQGLSPRLIYKNATDGNFAAVFLDQEGRLVVATYSTPEKNFDCGGVDVSAKDDPTAVNGGESRFVQYEVHQLPWKKDGATFNAATTSNFDAGCVYTIKPGYKGTIHIRDVSWKTGDAKHHVAIDFTFAWPPTKFLDITR